jgi:hypothetical protein
MDIDKYIDDNLDELILAHDYNNDTNIVISNDNEDVEDDNDDFYEELYYKTHDKITSFKNNKVVIQEDNDGIQRIFDAEDIQRVPDEITQEDNKEQDLLYYFHLINIFTKYYNEKYEKTDNFFSGIEDYEKDTSTAMELFFEAIMEFNNIKNILKIENNNLLKFIIEDTKDIDNSREKIGNLFEFDQVYCLEYKDKKLCTISLITVLNYIYENNLLDENNDWKIYNLKET